MPVILTLGSSMGGLRVQDQPRQHRGFELVYIEKGVSRRKDGRGTGEEGEKEGRETEGAREA